MSVEKGILKRSPTPEGVNFEELAQMYESIPERVAAELAARGVSIENPHPDPIGKVEEHLVLGKNGDPMAPEDLTSVDSLLLGQMFSYFTSWANYLDSLMSMKKTQAVLEKDLEDLVKSVLVVAYREEGLAVNIIDQYVKCDRRWVEVHARYTGTRHEERLLTSRYEQLKRALHAISREQTRRGEMMQAEGHSRDGGDGWRRTQGGTAPSKNQMFAKRYRTKPKE